MPECVDKEHARRLLEASLEQVDDEDKKYLGMTNHSPTPVANPGSVPFTSLMMNFRNQIYMAPLDEFDPHHRVNGRKAFVNANVRCLQSKINLKMRQEEAKKREREKVSVKQEFIDEFDRKFTDNCDNKKMNRKQRGVSMDNPFEQHNKPPIEHLIPEKILDKPGAIRNLNKLGDARPLAGRFSEIGERIFTLGGKKAS